jgi:prefoldin subunit 5
MAEQDVRAMYALKESMDNLSNNISSLWEQLTRVNQNLQDVNYQLQLVKEQNDKRDK